MLLLSVSTPAWCERLPLRAFTPVDGLPSEGVNAVLPDRSGYLWIACDDGLSLFDGHGFRNYQRAEGLPHAAVTRLLETSSGAFWVGTSAGLCRFEPSGGRDSDAVLDIAMHPAEPAGGQTRFDCERLGDSGGSSFIQALTEQPVGRLWIGTANGLFVLEGARPSGARPVELPIHPLGAELQVNGLTGDGNGGLWIGTDHGLVHRLPDGLMRRHPVPTSRKNAAVRGLLRDRTGRIWVGMDGETYVFWPRGEDGRGELEPGDDPVTTAEGQPLRLPRRAGEGRLLTASDGLPAGWYRALLEDRDGHIWLGAESLVEIDGEHLRTFGSAEGLRDPTVLGLAEDLWGNLWIATEAGGLLRLYPDGFTTYGVEDGLASDRIAAIFESRRGDLCVVTGPGDRMRLNRLAGSGFVSARPNLPPGLHHGSWGWNQLVLQDRDGDWWIPTGEGLVRFPAVERPEELAGAPPRAWYRMRDGLPADEIFRLFEDSRGDLWIGTVSSGRPTLGRWERATGSFHIYDLREDPGGFAAEAPSAFREDRAGNVWIGFGGGGLLRYRDERFDVFPPGEGVPEGRVMDLYVDRLGGLWVATSKGGAAHCDDPVAPAPAFRRYTSGSGLASDRVNCIVEDRLGRIYLGTARGVNRLDPSTGAIRRFTIEDGLVRDNVSVAFRDAQDDLWFGTLRGLSRLRPRPDPPEPPLVIRITDLSIGGADISLPDLGLVEMSGVQIQPDANHLQIGFAAPGFVPGKTVRYQYRLGHSDWSAPFAERSVHLGGLSPGRYRFEVRAATTGGAEEARPAALSFVVRAPIWQRDWVLAIAATAVAIALVGLHRMRVAHLRALELQRTGIAMDLHDDVGSGLGSIVVLANLAAGASMVQDDRRRLLGQIEDTAVEMVHVLTDIVHMLRPGEATLQSLANDLAARGRRLFPGTDVALTIDYPPRWPRAALSLKVRRNALLIGVEALHNAARHAAARHVVLELRPEGRRWRLSVRDDGRGIGGSRPDGSPRGLGLESMQRRAQEIGAVLRHRNRPGGGTEVVLLFDRRAGDRRLRRP